MRRRAVLALALALTGCVTDHVLAIDLVPPRAPDGGPAIDAGVTTIELALHRVDEGEACGSALEAAEGRAPGRVAHAQTFTVEDGMGTAIGEVPSGRWALFALGRTDGCAARLYGCVELLIGDEAPERVVVPLEPVDVPATCGCRACEGATCAPLAEPCP